MDVNGYFKRGLTADDIEAARKARELNLMRAQLAQLDETQRAREARGKKLSRKQRSRQRDLASKIGRASSAIAVTPPSFRRVSEPAKSFYLSKAWLQLRYAALHKFGRRCMACGATDGKMHVDHIKPRSIYPHLELEPDNVQILCEACNVGKSNLFETDWRQKEERVEPMQLPSKRVTYQENALRWACEQAAGILLK